MNRRLIIPVTIATLALTALAQAPLEQQLTKKEQKLELLNADYWRTQYAIDAGNIQLSAVPIQKEIRNEMSEPKFLGELRAAKFSDPVVQRRRDLFEQETAVTQISSDAELAKLVEDIGKLESAMRFKVGDKELKRTDINNILGHSTDRKLRKQAWLAQSQLTGKTGENIRRAMKMRLVLAQKYSDRPFIDLMLQHKGISSRAQLLDWFEQIRKETEPEYQRLLARMQRELKIDKVEPWDLEYYFSTLSGDYEQERFTPERTWPQIKQVAGKLGFNFDALPVQHKITEITFGGGTYPILYRHEVKILVNRYAGIRFTDTLFHEAGHGLHYSFTFEPRLASLLQGQPSDENASFMLESAMAEPFDEGLGQVMALMIYRDDIAKGIFGLTPEQTKASQERYRLKSLYDLRSTIADSMFEFAAYEKPDQNLAVLYNRINTEYLGVDMHGAHNWAYDPFYSTGPIYLQSYVLAEMVGRQIHHALDQKFGKVWDKDAGSYLREKFFSRGGRLTIDEIMREGTGEPLTPKYMVEALRTQ